MDQLILGVMYGGGSYGTSFCGGTGGGSAYEPSGGVDYTGYSGGINGGKGGLSGNRQYHQDGAGNPMNGAGGLIVIYSNTFQNKRKC